MVAARAEGARSKQSSRAIRSVFAGWNPSASPSFISDDALHDPPDRRGHVSSGTAKEKTGKSWFTNRLWIAGSLEMAEAAKAFGVELVHVFCAGGPGGEPALRSNDFQPADRRAVTGGRRELGPDLS